MAIAEYTYSIANDTANGKVSDTLHIEIWDSSIVIALHTVMVDESQDLLTISFEDSISTTDKATLDTLVSSHQGIELEPEPPKVVVDNAVAVEKGTDDFDTLISHDWTDSSSWTIASDSTWKFEPSAASKQIKMVKSEVQFSHDVKLGAGTPPGELYFDIWVYNPLFDPQQSIDADDPAWQPGNPGNPLRFLFKRTVFASIRDVYNYGNEHYSNDNPVDDIPTGVTTVKFNYDQTIILRGDQGAQVRFSLKDHNQAEGSYCTVSVVVREEDIPS